MLTTALATDPRPAPPPAWARLASGSSANFAWSDVSQSSDLAAFSWQGRDSLHARYYNPNIARFLSVDPGRDNDPKVPQSWNLYAYVRNNPLKLVDPNGKEVMVFVVGGGNILEDVFTAQGHAAIYVSRDGRKDGVSEGTEVGFGNGISGFLSEYAKQGREVRMYVLGTSPEEDHRMLDFIASNPNGGIDVDSAWRSIFFSRENCTTAVGNVLESGGVVPQGSNPGRGLVVDRPRNLQRALEKGQLSSRVKVTHVFDPGKATRSVRLQRVNEEVIRVNGKLRFVPR